MENEYRQLSVLFLQLQQLRIKDSSVFEDVKPILAHLSIKLNHDLLLNVHISRKAIELPSQADLLNELLNLKFYNKYNLYCFYYQYPDQKNLGKFFSYIH